MPEIKILPAGETIYDETGGSLLEILLSHHILVENPCGGKGVCGKCRIRVSGENVPDVSETERTALTKEELDAGIRLACLVKPTDNMLVELLQKEREGSVLTDGFVPQFERDPEVSKKRLVLRKPTLEDPATLEAQILEQTGAAKVALDVFVQDAFSHGVYTAIVRDGEVTGMEQGDTTKRLFGAAIDIGTTTVVCALVDMNSGEEIAHASRINAQKRFGFDVLTRITYELEHPENGVRMMQELIVDQLNEMLGELCERADVRRAEIYELAVAANSTMMHLLLGVDATSIGKAPYLPKFTGARYVPAKLLGIDVAKGAQVYCLPAVSSYIGADIAAGVCVCGLKRERGNVLFLDIGTNGEIVLSRDGALSCCSCAAGPALEGMNISSGMRAADGAIEDVKLTEDGVELTVIGAEKPAGICGSGILAAVKELLQNGMIRKSGAFVQMKALEEDDWRRRMLRMNGTKREVVLAEGEETVKITQGDIRQVQLAKGAILSGFLALLRGAGIAMEDLDKIYIAGQFGAHLPAESLTGTGILPKEVEHKIAYIGNSSKTGAYMALLSGGIKRELEATADQMDYMELGAQEGYERLFSECLLFPDVTGGDGAGERGE